MALLLIAVFIVVPIAELYVIIQVGQLIGIWPTLFLLLADAVLGSMLLKHQGRSAWRRFNEALASRRFPGCEVADGALIIVGGTLLLTPGFITDVFGALPAVAADPGDLPAAAETPDDRALHRGGGRRRAQPLRRAAARHRLPGRRATTTSRAPRKRCRRRTTASRGCRAAIGTDLADGGPADGAPPPPPAQP